MKRSTPLTNQEITNIQKKTKNEVELQHELEKMVIKRSNGSKSRSGSKRGSRSRSKSRRIPTHPHENVHEALKQDTNNLELQKELEKMVIS